MNKLCCDAYTVCVHCRHGDRTPWTGDHCWPQDSSVWDCYLTNAEVPMYSLSQYGRVLPRLYRKSEKKHVFVVAIMKCVA